MKDTKNRILESALLLFAQRGYEAASMSDIASELGITKGALYRHFAGKRAILDGILERMREQDGEQARNCGVPDQELQAGTQAYRETELQDIRGFALAQFRYWTEDRFAALFRRMLALERYRDAEMMALYQNYLGTGPLKYMEELFAEMAVQGAWEASDAPEMALEFYGPMFLLMDVSDASQNRAEVFECLKRHIDQFIEKYNEVQEYED